MQAYDHLSKKELIQKLKKQAFIIESLIGDKGEAQAFNPISSDFLGDWYWDIDNNEVTGNDRKFLALQYTKEEMPHPITFQFFTNKIHPDHYEMVMENMRNHLHGRTPAYEIQYKIQTKDGNWKWYYDRGRITKYSKDGKPLALAGIVLDITKEKELIEQMKKQNEQLLRLVDTDNLTNVFNRKALFEKLQDEIESALHHSTDLNLFMLDIDHFKYINDTYGHLAGDEVLTKVATTIKDSIRETDIVGRYGGEEFLVIFPETTQQQCAAAAERIRKNIEDLPLPIPQNITVSGGIKTYNHESIDELVDKVDKAMYQAKHAGKNQIHIYPH